MGGSDRLARAGGAVIAMIRARLELDALGKRVTWFFQIPIRVVGDQLKDVRNARIAKL